MQKCQDMLQCNYPRKNKKMYKYTKVSENIQKILIDNPRTENEKLTWTNVVNAGKKEIEYLRKKYNFSMEYLRSAMSTAISQRTIIEKTDKYFFLILHFPVIENNQLVASEINFFIGHGYLITAHNGNISAFNEFFNFCRKDADSLMAHEMESSSILLYEILEKLILYCFGILDKTSEEIGQLNNIIFDQHIHKKSVARILSLRRNIINFRKIMQNHKNTLKKLMEMESSIVPTVHIKKQYKELIERSKRIWEILENQKDMVDVLFQTNESLLNYRLNDIIKTLTIFSVIVFPLTLLAAVFGMNITGGMPFVNINNGFWIIISIMIFCSLGMLFLFENKKWL